VLPSRLFRTLLALPTGEPSTRAKVRASDTVSRHGLGPRVLVTGASGLIGHAIVAGLIREQVRVTAVGRRPSADASWLSLDLTKEPWPVDEWDVIVHCAANIPMNFDGPEARTAERENRMMDDRAVGLAAATKAHLVYVSSASVYGGATGEIDEETPTSPLVGYSREKLATEAVIATSGVDATIFRLTSPYGARQQRNTVLRRFLDAALSGAPLKYFGTGVRTQDFLHVEDVAAAAMLAVRHRIPGCFLLASGSAIPMRDLAGLIVEVTGSPSSIEAAGVPDPEENRLVTYRIDRARRELGFLPRVALADGLAAWASVRRDQLKLEGK
jgi:UDP-glucose 4-epimerase